MRIRTFARCSASVAALTLIAGPAWAQDVSATSVAADAAAQPAPAPQPADPVAQDDQGVTDPADPGEEIIVTGIVASLRSQQNIRRNSDQIVDAVVAEDIGKLPDIAVSDTAARIPGVQVERTGGEASNVLVRGLPDFATTYNGREIFTAETRLVALQDFPSANIQALEVFKTSTANLVEAGLAGLINVRSRRPFDFRESQFAGSVWGLYTYQADKLTPNANVLWTDRWDVGDGEIGLLINASYTELQYLDSEPSNTDFLQTFTIEGNRLICCGGPDARFPDVQRLFYNSGNRVRPSVNAAFQWRPNDTLEFYAEALWQGFREKQDDRLIAVPLYNGGSYSNLVFRPGTNLLESGTITGLGDPIFTFQGGTYNRTNTFQYAAGAIYEEGPLRISADLAFTDSTFTGSTESVDRIFAGQGNTTVNFDLTTPQFSLSGFDVNNINNYLFDGLYEEQQESSGSDTQFRVDGRYDFDEGFFIDSFEVGFRYSDRVAHREFGNRFAGFRGRNIPASALPLEYRLSPPGFRGTDIQSGFRSFLTPTYQSIRDNRVALRQFVINQGITCCFGTFTTAPPAPDPNQTYDATERTIAGYAQLNYQFGESIDGVIGLRVVKTDTRVTGTATVEGVASPINVGPSYTDYLPNVSLRWRIAPQFQLRLSATQTRTRPTFAQLNPSFSVGPVDPLTGRRTGGGGNPNLEPFTSDNYDAALEYYFSRTGFASLSVFRRDLFGFIQNRTEDVDDPALGPIRISRPVNAGEGRITGAEAQIQTFFDFGGLPDWLSAFGIQANLTYLDTEIDSPTSTAAFVRDRILGVSEWTYNIIGLYERGGLSARLTYNGRSSYLDRRDVRGASDLFTEEAFPAPRLDLSLNYDLIENATLFFDWTNILQDPARFTFSSARDGAPRAEYPRFLRFEETTVSIGLRFRL